MITLTLLLLLAAVIVAIASAMGKVPLWISVILLCIVVTLVVYPGRV